VKFSSLDSKYLRVITTQRLDEEAVRTRVSSHGNKGGDVHAIMRGSEEDDTVYSTDNPLIIFIFRS
jgi:hypothetical protein